MTTNALHRTFTRPAIPALSLRTRALLVSQVFALVWFAVAAWLDTLSLIPVWFDQEHIFMPATAHLLDPYAVHGFISPPWLAVILWPLAQLPLALAVYLQTALTFGLLALALVRFGGGLTAVVIASTSFIAFTHTLEMNVEWIILAAFLMPVKYSAPLAMLKPQISMGYYAGFGWRDWLRTFVVAGVTLAVSFAVWGLWPVDMAQAVERVIGGTEFNLAPVVLLPWPVSLSIGGLLLWRSWRRSDPLLGVIAFVFVTPYLRLYSLLIPFGLCAVRWPRATGIVSLALWVCYGGIIVMALIGG